jgi:hypothetical protein
MYEDVLCSIVCDGEDLEVFWGSTQRIEDKVKERHTTEYYAADRSNRGCIAP